MPNLQQIKTEIEAKKQTATLNFPFSIKTIPGDEEVLQITMEDLDDLAILLSISDQDINCVAHMFLEDEVKPDHIANLNDTLLHTNLITPLCNFAKIDDQYLIKGSIPLNSNSETITELIQNMSFALVESFPLIQDDMLEAELEEMPIANEAPQSDKTPNDNNQIG